MALNQPMLANEPMSAVISMEALTEMLSNTSTSNASYMLPIQQLVLQTHLN